MHLWKTNKKENFRFPFGLRCSVVEARLPQTVSMIWFVVIYWWAPPHLAIQVWIFTTVSYMGEGSEENVQIIKKKKNHSGRTCSKDLLYNMGTAISINKFYSWKLTFEIFHMWLAWFTHSTLHVFLKYHVFYTLT